MATDLPEDSQLKRRARRRLIGAIALVLLAVIVLPMIFDAEQKPLDQDVSIQIPNQGDYVAKAPPAGGTPPAAKAGDKDPKAAPEPPKDATPPAPPKDEAKSAPPAPPADAPKDTPKDAKAEAPKADAKADEAKAAAAKAAAEAKAAVDAKAAAKAASDKAAEEKARAQAEAKRAAALLNGAGDAPTSAKADKTEKAATGTFVIQIGAFSAEEKAQEVRDKLSAAGLKSYSEKVATKSGDVTRVRAGPFASKEAAESAKAKIAGLGFASATVVHR